MAKVLVPIADGIEELESVTIIDVLRRAGAQVTVASVSTALQVTASRKTKLVADAMIQDCAGMTFDAIILPGGMPGAEHLRDSAPLIELLKQQVLAGRLYGAICASPAVVLARHGFLKGRKATCYPSMETQLPDASAAAKRVVIDHHCITSQGPGTAMDFALAVVEALFGAERRRQVAEPMLVV
ncbi:MAG TPA: DJ-1/PfpI family protein [Anaerohalosphaeraceae bacterium]|nr:DJ-1/PfpI family protein [Anaerohalosphaeraceae bacterium]